MSAAPLQTNVYVVPSDAPARWGGRAGCTAVRACALQRDFRGNGQADPAAAHRRATEYTDRLAVSLPAPASPSVHKLKTTSAPAG